VTDLDPAGFITWENDSDMRDAMLTNSILIEDKMKRIKYDIKEEDIIDVEFVDITPSTLEVKSQITFYNHIKNLIPKYKPGMIVNKTV
jgi:hypothetical protein